MRDDVIFRELITRVPAGCQLSAVMDCCHNGTIFDLPYIFVANEQHMEDTSMQHMSQNPSTILHNNITLFIMLPHEDSMFYLNHASTCYACDGGTVVHISTWKLDRAHTFLIEYLDRIPLQIEMQLS